MNGWYDEASADNSVIISSRVRLARNIKMYPFQIRINERDSVSMISDVENAINSKFNDPEQFKRLDIAKKNIVELNSLVERHVISPAFIKITKPKGLMVYDNNSVSVMINEEDHIRIQCVYPGENIDKASDMANRVDDLIEESLEIAFDSNYGYLTSCPTNTGTGLRASYMMHLPMLEKTGQIKNIISAIGKFGMIIRGIYGENTDSSGNIYQLSNQVTLGKSEDEIITALKNMAYQIIEKENNTRNYMLTQRKTEFEDGVYRSLGILTNCRKISVKEAETHLSNLRLGYLADMELPKMKTGIYGVMINIQLNNLLLRYNNEILEKTNHDESMQNKKSLEIECDALRAKYIRENILGGTY